MRKPPPDDWGRPIGSDPEPELAPQKKKTTKHTATSLVYLFRDSLPLEAMDRVGAPVNGPALIKGFKKLADKGFTYDEIAGMISAFVSKIRSKPLPSSVVPWRAFLADLDSLATSYRQMHPQESYGKWGIDTRLMED